MTIHLLWKLKIYDKGGILMVITLFTAIGIAVAGSVFLVKTICHNIFGKNF